MRNKLRLLFFSGVFICTGCNSPSKRQPSNARPETDLVDSGFSDTMLSTKFIRQTPVEKSMLKAGMVDVRLLNRDIRVWLLYAGDSNFLHQDLYGKLNKAYLASACAKKLALAQTLLSATNPGYSLLVWDAARPVSIQKRMWNAVDFPVEERTQYVSNPKNHSLHNYGCAVDVTIIDNLGEQLDMGTEFDEFDTLAQPIYELKCLASGLLVENQVINRKLLRHTMHRAGFRQLPSEWWHYNCCSREYAKEHFMVVE